MSKFSFKTPDVGEGIVEVELIAWHIAVGDGITEDQPIADVMTDKANVELSSPVAGRVLRLACQVGDRVAVGAELVLFDTDLDAPSPPPAELPSAHEPPVSTVSPAAVSPAPPRTRPLASPAVRRRALDAEIELGQVPGSGPGGRISHDDLDAFLALPQAALSTARTATERIKVTGLRRLIAERLQIATRTIPHYSYVEEIDLTELEALRSHLNDNRGAHQPRLTLLPFLIQALVRALRHYPEVNATFDDQAGIVTRYAGVHVGIATHTDQGLKVPVMRHAESRTLWGNAMLLQRLTEAARDNSIGATELSGSTITISSLGRLGGIAATPVLNKPEVAIIGVNKAQQRVVVRDGQMVIRTMMNISSSFDHRIVDGHVAAAFIQAVKGLLEHPATLFIPEAG